MAKALKECGRSMTKAARAMPALCLRKVHTQAVFLSVAALQLLDLQ